MKDCLQLPLCFFGRQRTCALTAGIPGTPLWGYGGRLGKDSRHMGEEMERDYGYNKNRFCRDNGLRRML